MTFLQRLIWKLFPPYEVRATIAEVRAFFDAHLFLSRDLVESGVRTLLRDVPRAIHTVRIDGVKPQHLALMLISNVLANELPSGQHHIYRGALGISGNDMLSMWITTIEEMRKNGCYTDAQAEKDMKWMQDQIKEVG